MSSHSYIPWSELMSAKISESELNEILATFNKLSVLNFLTNINNFLALFPPNQKRETFEKIQGMLTANLLDDVALKTYNESFAHKGISLFDRPLFHRQQILTLMKKTLLYSDNLGGIKIEDTKEAKYILGKVALVMSDFLVDDTTQNLFEADSFDTRNEHNKVLNELLTQMLPVIELYNPLELTDSVSITTNYIRLFDSMFPDFINNQTISEYFEEKNKVTLENFLKMIVCVYASYSSESFESFIQNPAKFNYRKSDYFSKLKFSNVEIDGFFELVSKNINDLEIELKSEDSSKTLKPQYDFLTFRKYPILFLDDDIFTCLDVSFIVEKLSSGFYHTIHNSLPDDEKNPFRKDKKLSNDFSSNWGYVFQNYVNDILGLIFPPVTNRYFPNIYFDMKDEEEIDGIIDYVHSIFLMEYKGNTLNSAKYSGDVELFFEEFNKKFGIKKNKSGVRQLARKTELLYNSDLSKRKKLRSFDTSSVKVIYPILIVNELSLSFGLANWKLREWFNKERENRHIGKDITVEALLVLTIEDLEELLPYIENGDFTLLNFIQYYNASLNKTWFEPMTRVSQVFKHFRQEKDFKPRVNRRLEKIWIEFIDELRPLFKADL
jgi:hypothetical protein